MKSFTLTVAITPKDARRTERSLERLIKLALQRFEITVDRISVVEDKEERKRR